MNVVGVIQGTGDIIQEPNWELLFSDIWEIEAAKEYWRVLTTELKDRNLLAPVNSHSVQRLICHWIMFDRMYRECAENGIVLRPKRGAKGAAMVRISPHFTALREANSDAFALEAELGLSPRRRGSVTPVGKKAVKSKASDAYLGKTNG